MKKAFLVAGIILLVGSISVYIYLDKFVLSNIYAFDTKNIESNNTEVILPVKEEIKIPDFVVITFAGDVMMDRAVRSSVNKNFQGDYYELFKNVDIFKTDDISFVNLEGPVSDKGHNVGSKYSFRMDPKVIDALKKTGVDITSFANNHVGDYTVKAFLDTLDRLTIGEILFTGAGNNYAEVTTPTVIEKNNIKTCFLGFSDVGPQWMKATNDQAGILLASDPDFAGIITRAKIGCDVLIVSFHWGVEYKPHTTRQATLAHLALDSGANIVVGHHPHVAQDVEIYKDKPIMYSLGNYVFDQYFSKETMQGLVVQMKVYKNGEVKDIKQYDSKQNKFYQIESITEKVEIVN